jgi:hypothetical protein
VSPNETTAPGVRPHRRRRALSSGAAIVLGTLLVGGATTYAAATASANSQTVSTSGAAVGAPTVVQPTVAPGSPATTTTVPSPTAQSAGVTDATGSPSVAAKQTIGISILPGSLTVTPTAETVTVGPGRLGSLSPITVDDARGSLAGWRTTVSLQAVSGLDAAQLASTRLCVTPHPTTLVAGNPADSVRSSPRACAGPGDPIAVFFAAPGGGGGEYSDTAGVALELPDGASSGGITASVAVSVS